MSSFGAGTNTRAGCSGKRGVPVFGSGLSKPIKTLAVFGGVSINPQMIALQGVNILVATPGRLLELVESNAVHLSGIDTLVLDEADKMLNLGFKEEMNRIFALVAGKTSEPVILCYT